MKNPQPLQSTADVWPDEQEAAAELARNAAKMRRMRAYHTLVLTVALGTAALYIAGAVYALVML